MARGYYFHFVFHGSFLILLHYCYIIDKLAVKFVEDNIHVRATTDGRDF